MYLGVTHQKWGFLNDSINSSENCVCGFFFLKSWVNNTEGKFKYLKKKLCSRKTK